MIRRVRPFSQIRVEETESPHKNIVPTLGRLAVLVWVVVSINEVLVQDGNGVQAVLIPTARVRVDQIKVVK